MDHFAIKWKRMSFLFLLSLLPAFSPLMAHQEPGPPPSFQHQGKDIIYVDFQTAVYDIHFDLSQRVAQVRSKIRLIAHQTGHPVFDLVQVPQRVILDGVEVEQRSIRDPHKTTTFRYVDQEIGPGEHELEIHHQLTQGVEFDGQGGVRSGFFMSDLTDRNFLEKYLPCNWEYDQVSMVFRLHFDHDSNPVSQTVISNGQVEKQGKSWTLRFPSSFTSSSPYFHTFPKNAYAMETFQLKSQLTSAAPRSIPVTIYTLYESNLAAYKRKLIEVFHELERDYGPWPHPQLIVYGAGSGGMEYCGATITSLSALGHEMTHSYFARGVMPANGNAGWIDEAVASWRDENYPRNSRLSFASSRLGGHSPYRRSTDREAYTKGMQLLGHLDYLMADRGGLKAFLARLVQNRQHHLIVNSLFQSDLQKHFNTSFDEIFDQYVYGTAHVEGKQGVQGDQEGSRDQENPYHPRLSEEELRALL